MTEIRKEWEAIYKTGTASKAEYETLSHSLNLVLEKRLSNRDVRALALSCGKLGKTEDARNQFENAVLEYVFRVLVESGDRERLVTMLALCFPTRGCGVQTVELHLALNERRLADPMLLLGEAYSRCGVPAVRQNIAAAVRRAFTDPAIPANGEAEFVANAMQWYRREKDQLVVNERYGGDVFLPLEASELPRDAYKDRHEPFNWQPLFVPKPSAGKANGR